MPHGTANGTFVVVPVLFNQSIRVIDYSSDVFASIETSRGPNFQKNKKEITWYTIRKQIK
jgi:hypothetical protein